MICQGREFDFHKSLLTDISSVFKTSFETPYFPRLNEDIIEIDDVFVETIEAFQKVLYDDIIDLNDLTAELMLFAHQRDIKPLVNICREHIGTLNLSKEDFVTLARVSYFMDDVELFTKMFRNMEKIVNQVENDSEWNLFAAKHPKFLNWYGKIKETFYEENSP